MDYECAKAILDMAPRLMRFIRQQMRAASELSVPQFRVLAHLSQAPATNTELAERQGTTTPTMCRIVNGLVDRGLVRRDRSESADRRQVSLHLTKKGWKQYDGSRQFTKQVLVSSVLSGLTKAEKEKLRMGVDILLRAFQ